jgi:hypothetical protein
MEPEGLTSVNKNPCPEPYESNPHTETRFSWNKS